MGDRTPEQIADEALAKAGIGKPGKTARNHKNGGNVFLHDPRPPEFSDEALALRFAEIHARPSHPLTRHGSAGRAFGQGAAEEREGGLCRTL